MDRLLAEEIIARMSPSAVDPSKPTGRTEGFKITSSELAFHLRGMGETDGKLFRAVYLQYVDDQAAFGIFWRSYVYKKSIKQGWSKKIDTDRLANTTLFELIKGRRLTNAKRCELMLIDKKSTNRLARYMATLSDLMDINNRATQKVAKNMRIRIDD